MRVKIRNLDEIVRKIERLSRAAGEELVSGLRVVGDLIMTDVKASRPGSGIPKDTGVLSSSGRVEGPDSKGVVRLTFGGSAAPYALRQHEDLTYRHPLGEARYLVRGAERFEPGQAQKALEEVADAAIQAAKRA